MSDAVSGDLLTEQVDYYRRRAAEYDATSHGELARARTRIARLVGEMQPVGRVLEIACGTGLWTEALAGAAESVTAIDASPEMLAIARGRVRSANVTFEVADVFSWRTGTRYDVIFFACWLSHVPTSRYAEFWSSLADRLADGGRVLFVDEHVDERAKEAYVEGQAEIVERTLNDGSMFRVVKNFLDPERLTGELHELGWAGTSRRDGSDWVVGEARRAS